MTLAIHHVLKYISAPTELSVLPTSLKARGARLQLLACPGFGAAEVPPALPGRGWKCATYSTGLLIQTSLCVKCFLSIYTILWNWLYQCFSFAGKDFCDYC